MEHCRGYSGRPTFPSKNSSLRFRKRCLTSQWSGRLRAAHSGAAHRRVRRGNHDFLAQELAGQGNVIFRHAQYLEDQDITIDGVKFYGAPWIPELFNWANYREEAELIDAWARIPDDTDILITHTPPFGILDRNSRGKHCGCPHLRKAVELIRPQVHCFGHVHAGAGAMHDEHTTYINASVVNSKYEIIRAPIELEIQSRART